MTLTNFENYIPAIILQRGIEYCHAGRVHDLTKNDAQWTATVSGTDEYEVEITIEDEEVTDWYCDCPYDGGNICKHVVAVLFAIRIQCKKVNPYIEKMEAESVQIEIDGDVRQALKTIEPGQLEPFVLEYASEHADFKQALLHRFASAMGNPQALNTNHLHEVESCFPDSYIYTCYHGEEIIDFSSVTSGLERLQAKAELFFNQKVWGDAASLALQIIRSVGEHYEEDRYEYYDERGEMSFPCEESKELLLKIVQSPEVEGHLKEEIWQELRALNELSALGDYCLLDMEELTHQVSLYALSKEEALALCDKAIREGEEEGRCSQPVLRKAEVLEFYGDEEAVEQLLQNYSNSLGVRNRLIDMLHKQDRNEEVLKQVADGISLIETDSEKNWTTDDYALEWRKLALGINESKGDISQAIAYCRDLFIETGGDGIYYRKLKSWVDKAEWKAFLQKLMRETSFYDSFDESNEAEIYVAEKDDKALCCLLTSERLDLPLVIRYAAHLQKPYTSQVFAALEARMRTYAEEKMGREHYKRLAEYLRNLKKLEGGNTVVERLVNDFRALYKRRSAMMQELGNI